MKCANCVNDAFYIYQLTATSQILYCNKHLPKFLEQAKKAGLLKTTESLKQAIDEGMKNIVTPSIPSTVDPIIETVAPVAEEVPAPKPKKKAAKKKAE